MWHDKIIAHDIYLKTLDAIWKSTFGRAEAATASILTIDQLNMTIQKLSEEEKKQVEYVGNMFLWEAKQSYEALEEILKEKYDNDALDSNTDLQLAIKAYEKLALNQRIAIKNTIMKFKGDSGIQRTLINASNSLEQIHEFIVRIERVLDEDAKEIHGDNTAIQWAAEAEKWNQQHPHPSPSILTQN